MAPGYLTVWPANASRPVASDLNWHTGQTVANMDVVELAPGGTIELYDASGNVDVIVDVLGYFTTATTTWTDAVPSNPSAPPPAGLNQGPIGMVYDPATNQDIVLDIMTTTSQVTTWAWNGSSWAQQPTAHSPSFFGDFSSPSNLAYDAATGTVVFVDLDEQAYFYVDTTWTWNGTDWNQQFPANEPNSVGNLAYDAATKTVVLDDGSTWNWDGTNWTRSATTTTPVTNGESMAYDPTTATVVDFGGSVSCNTQGQCTYSNGTWSWDGTSWSTLSLPTSPPGRDGAAMAFDPDLGSSGEMVLFGGYNGNAVNDT